MSEPAFLVTGATGFVGRHLLEALRGRRVVALARRPEEWAAYDWTAAHPDVEVVAGSVTRPEAWCAALPPLAGIFHLAAVVQHTRRDTDEMTRTNVEGGLAMLRLAAAARCRVVAISSTGTVGCFASPDERADEDSPFAEALVGSWPYYRSKIELERRARALAAELGVELVLIRPPVLLGPGDHRLRSTRNVWKAIHRKLPFLVRGGMHFADVRDAAQAVANAMQVSPVRPVYHVEGTECSIEAFFGMVEEVSGVPRPRFVLPFRAAWLAARALERLHVVPDPVVIEMASRHWGARSRFAAQDLGYKARDPRETLRDTVEWLRAHPAPAKAGA